MTQDDVELVRAAFDAWNAGDMDTLRAVDNAEALRSVGLPG